MVSENRPSTVLRTSDHNETHSTTLLFPCRVETCFLWRDLRFYSTKWGFRNCSYLFWCLTYDLDGPCKGRRESSGVVVGVRKSKISQGIRSEMESFLRLLGRTVETRGRCELLHPVREHIQFLQTLLISNILCQMERNVLEQNVGTLKSKSRMLLQDNIFLDRKIVVNFRLIRYDFVFLKTT